MRFGTTNKFVDWRGFLRTLQREWARNRLTDAAAALTFYGILALFPFVLFIVAAAGLLIRPEQVQALGDALTRDVPPALAPILDARLAELTSRPRVGVLTFSALGAVWSSTTGVGVTYGALGGIIILLLWMWISSLALMLGAEINAVLGFHSRDGPQRSGLQRFPNSTSSNV